MTNVPPAERAAVYARYSCDGQRDVSIEDQLDAAVKWAREHKVDIVATYSDRAISGRSADRPGFQAMLAAMDGYDAVLIWNTDRFARNMFDSFRYLGDLTEAGKRVYSITQPELNDDSPVRMLLYSIYSWKDQRYSEDLSKNVTRGMRAKAERCQYLGYQTYGYSHDGDAIVVDPEQADVVRDVFRRFLAGQKPDTIAKALDARGVRTPRGSRPTYNWVDRMLKNEKYAGVYVWKDVRVPGGMPRIVDDTTFLEAQAIRGSRVRRDRSHDYLLSGMLYCRSCGEVMHGESCKNHQGVDYTYYVCKGRDSSCRGGVRADLLDAAVMRAIRACFSDEDWCEAAMAQMLEAVGLPVEYDVQGIERRRSQVQKRRGNVLKAVADGLPYADARPMLDEIDAELEGLERRLVEARSKSSGITADDLEAIFAAVRSGLGSDRDVLDACCDWVELDEDSFYIVFSVGDTPVSRYEVDAAISANKKAEPDGSANLRLVPQMRNNPNLLVMQNGFLLASGF